MMFVIPIMEENRRYSTCDDSCPLLGKCIKYRMDPEDLIKLEQVIAEWEKNKKTMDFFAAVGRMVQKLRIPIHGQSH